MTGLLIAFVLLAAITATFMVGSAVVFDRRERAWARERSELLNRIQHPERVPVQPVAWGSRPEREPDELHLVGRVEVDG